MYRALVTARAGHRCEYCHAPEIVFNFPFEIEHIQPLARGGSNEPDNLALARRACNLFKSDAELAFDNASEAEARLFHPRTDEWCDHFYFAPETGELMGKTPTGRATPSRLRLKRPHHMAARRHWIALGIFP